jgi:hypothetical protein
MVLQIVIGTIYIAIGMFYSLSGFGVIQPFKGNLRRTENLNKYQYFYRFGGLVIAIYGVIKIYNLSGLK